MKLNKKIETEICKIYDTWMHSYLNGDVDTYDSFLDDEYHFIGSATKEEFLNRKDTTQFFADTGDQFAGKTEIRNESKTIEQFSELIFITHVFDAWFLHEKEWNYYARFRFSSTLRKNKDGWRFIYQHFSIPDAKTDEGETIGYDKINDENQELREAIQRRTIELEQKNRELEIETALEKVRSRTMAMQHSDELPEAANTLFLEVQALGIPAWSCGYNILSEDKESSICIMSSEGELQDSFLLPLTKHKSLKPWHNAIKNKEEFFVYGQEGNNLAEHYKYMESLPELKATFAQFEKAGIELPKRQFNHLVRFNEGFLLFITYEEVPNAHDIFKRFGKVFEQTYTRFLELKKAEAQAREAQIDLALERIRSQAMAMKESSDLLDIVVTMRNEFIKLGHEAHYFWHMMWLPETYEKAMTSGDGTKIGFVMELPRHMHGDIPLLEKWEKSKKPTVVYTMNADEAIDYVDKMVDLGDFKSIDPQAPSHDDIRHIKGLTFIMARTSHGEIGYSLPGIVKNPPKEDINILIQFAGAFDLAHRRFLDLQKSEKQARETQIELALEKVRSRTMAMQRSEELADVASVLFLQVKELGIEQWTCGFNIWEIGNTEFKYFPGGPDGKMLPSCIVPLMEHPVFREFVESKKRGDDLMVYKKEGDIQNDHYKYMLSLPGIGDMLQDVLDQGMEFPDFQIDHIANFAYGNIVFITYQPVPEMHDVFKRFAKVFEQTYTRFLDLQKAEKQARESEIELALERVRARTMAMHNSEELKEVIQVVYDQFVQLNIPIEHAGFILDYKEKDDMHIFLADHNAVFPEISFPYFDCAHWNSYLEAKKKGTHFFANLLDFDEKNKFYNDLFQFIPDLPEEVKATYFSCDGLAISTALLDNVGLYIENYSAKPFSDEENDILMRFGKVFQQTYTRFLDLQKVEAQAREAQIEASLERVRSSSMAMHKSEELHETSSVLFQELSKLGIEKLTTGYVLFDEEEKIGWSHSLDPRTGKIMNAPVGLRQTETKVMKSITTSWKKQEPVLVLQLNEKETLKHQTFMAERTINFPMTTKQLLAISPKRLVIHTFNFNQGYLLLVGKEILSQEQRDMLIRFAKVFEMTYRRFLDLQKAEAQAREAQIEASLERVRSRSMAMQKSSELLEAGELLWNEIIKLGVDCFTSGYVLMDENENIGWNYTPNPSTGKILEQAIGIPHKQTTPMRKIVASWKTQEPLCVIELTKKQTIAHQTFVAEKGINFPFSAKQLVEISPKEIVLHTFNFKQGYLLIVGGEKISKDQIDLMLRFTKVFQQTYTRFLDLQKAEAQAREVQIEFSLERVRSQAMAMRKSEDLINCTRIVFDELEKLNLSIERSGIGIFDKETKDCKLWTIIINKEGKKELATGVTSLTIHPMLIETFNAWENQKPFSYVLEGKELKAYYKLVTNSEFVLPEELIEKSATLPKEYYHYSPFRAGGLYFFSDSKPVDEEKQIIRRFAEVFDMTYTRFLDLQKSEAQARESQIQLALERVRAKTMAMQHSDELREVVLEIYQQLQILDFETQACNIIIVDKETKDMHYWVTGFTQAVYPESYHVPNLNHPYMRSQIKAWEDETTYQVFTWEGKGKRKFDDLFFSKTDFRKTPKEAQDMMKSLNLIVLSTAFTSSGMLQVIGQTPLNEEMAIILQRFAKVFNQTYTRFQDLQKAEAQTREAQIEMALEKVRSRTMAMQKGEEVKDVVVLLYKELIALGVTNFATCGYVEVNEETKRQATWVTNPGGDSLGLFHLPLTGDVHFDERYKAWKKQQPIFHQTVKGKERKKHLEYAITTFNSKEAEEMVLTQFPDPTVFYCFNFSHGYLHLVAGSQLTQDEEALLARFTRVFEQTYARFLDLKKAEEQTRTAQINLAVERVRAKALAMHKSEEIMEVVAKLKDEVMGLDIPDVVASTIFLNEDDDKVRMWDLSSLEHEENYSEVPFDITFKLKKSDPHLYVKRVWENPKDYFVEIQNEKDFERLMQWLREQNKKEIADEVEEFIEKVQLKRLYHAVKKLKNGKLVIDLLNPPSDEMESILTKMGAAFDLAYKRFEDLIKAEAQTREALIEAALEKVRSRSLAMHKPDELQEVITVVAEKLQELEVIFDSGGVILCTYFPDNKDVMHWIVTPDFSSSQSYLVPYFDNPIFSEAWESKNRGDLFFSKEFPVKEKNHFFEQAFKNSDYKYMPEDYKQHVLKADKHHLTAAWSKNSAILIPSLTDVIPSESDINIMIRFARVFEQAYIRFLDLQKSEAQAREAQIEAALERVRSRGMAMHKSEDLLDVITVVSEQLEQLNFKFVHVSFANNEIGQDYKYWVSAKGHPKPMRFTVPYKNITMLNSVKEAQEKSVSFYSDILTKEEHTQWHNHLLKHGGSNIFSKEENEFIMSRGMARSIAINPNIILILANYASIPYSEDENKIIERFGQVFEQSYTRFLDLQKAEAQARESQIETGLERVRSRTLAMQTSDELAETSVIVFKQLLELGIAPNRLFIGIIKDEGKKIEAWATNEDGNKLDKHFTLEASKNKSIKKMLEGWKQKKKTLVIDMKGKELQDYFQYLNEEMSIPFIHGLEQKRRVQTVAYFSGGLIGMAAPEEQPEETIKLLERFASVFNLTYTRFNDLKVAEAQTKKAEEDLIKLQAAKKSAEDALSELQLTQTQLIQSEKMASLGELTAGIAHEIQNPLNFVNNFSEVSKELLDEMLEEIENGDMEEVKAIMDDVIQNLEKINHHGKRADGIVKGMLQHSRSSTGTKEPTDINVLADEYLRLAYHGLRAKDKSFNATLVTDFDENIGKISIIPQDIGRVVLNLLTNAFYVVNEKKQLHIKGYEPTVSLTTKKHGNWVTISVKDNGNGIPQKVLDKIFQPFFTTKPTGQGTGLGLSMSYDIITKGHGGELKVETKEGKGTTFNIDLPLNLR